MIYKSFGFSCFKFNSYINSNLVWIGAFFDFSFRKEKLRYLSFHLIFHEVWSNFENQRRDSKEDRIHARCERGRRTIPYCKYRATCSIISYHTFVHTYRVRVKKDSINAKSTWDFSGGGKKKGGEKEFRSCPPERSQPLKFPLLPQIRDRIA